MCVFLFSSAVPKLTFVDIQMFIELMNVPDNKRITTNLIPAEDNVFLYFCLVWFYLVSVLGSEPANLMDFNCLECVSTLWYGLLTH